MSDRYPSTTYAQGTAMRESRMAFELLNRGYGGTLILNGHHDTSPVWRGHLEPNSPLIHGNTRTGQMEYVDPLPNPVAYVAQNMTVQPFSFVGGGDPYYPAPIPSRNTTIAVWAHAANHDIVNDAVRLLLNINRDPVQANYANIVQARLFDQMPGHWTTAIGYFNNKPKLLLSARGAALYVWLTYFNSVYTLTYSTDPLLMERAKEYVPEHMGNEFFYYPMLTLNNTSLVLAPLYVVNKFSKMLYEMPRPGARLTVVSYIKNYLERLVTKFEGAK